MNEVKLLDKPQPYSEVKAYTVAVASQLHKAYGGLRKMYPVFLDKVCENRRAWLLYHEWITKFPSGNWPNGKPLDAPEGVLTMLRFSQLSREMKRVGVWAGITKKTRFSNYPIGDDWILVAEKEHGRSKYCTRFNVAHVHPDGKHWLVGYYKPLGIGEQAPMGYIRLTPCLICKAEMPKQVEAWIRMIRLKERIGE